VLLEVAGEEETLEVRLVKDDVATEEFVDEVVVDTEDCIRKSPAPATITIITTTTITAKTRLMACLGFNLTCIFEPCSDNIKPFKKSGLYELEKAGLLEALQE
jgi:hypothetical protein